MASSASPPSLSLSHSKFKFVPFSASHLLLRLLLPFSALLIVLPSHCLRLPLLTLSLPSRSPNFHILSQFCKIGATWHRNEETPADLRVTLLLLSLFSHLADRRLAERTDKSYWSSVPTWHQYFAFGSARSVPFCTLPLIKFAIHST